MCFQFILRSAANEGSGEGKHLRLSHQILRRAPPAQDKFEIHSPCGNTPPKPADKNGFIKRSPDNCGKRTKSPSFFRRETRSFTIEGTAILSKPLQRDAEFFRTHQLLPLLTKKDFVLKEETWS